MTQQASCGDGGAAGEEREARVVGGREVAAIAAVAQVVSFGQRTAGDFKKPGKLLWSETCEALRDVARGRRRRVANLIAEFEITRSRSAGTARWRLIGSAVI